MVIPQIQDNILMPDYIIGSVIERLIHLILKIKLRIGIEIQ